MIMDKGKLEAKITSSLKTLQLDSSSYRPPLERARCRSLLSLCIGVLGKHFEDIAADLNEIAYKFPPDIKMHLPTSMGDNCESRYFQNLFRMRAESGHTNVVESMKLAKENDFYPIATCKLSALSMLLLTHQMAMLAVARRKNLLNDDVIIALAEKSWDILDISGSEVSDFGLAKVAELCHHLRAIDISGCCNVTALGVSNLLDHCHSLEVLRWGGCARSDLIARRCLTVFKPKLNHVEGESWEELDSMDFSNGVQSLRWLVWPTIDDLSKDTLATECPRIVVNPKPSPFGFRGVDIPREAFPGVALDDSVVKDIDPGTWAVRRCPRIVVPTSSDASELPMAERFRLAFVERDSRLAPKRAKNARQHRRRADRERVMMNTEAKSIALASSLASKFLLDRR